MMASRWATATPSTAAWRAPPGSSKDRSTEQDIAAGGRERRLIRLPGGQLATASVALKQYTKTRRIYAYLRYSRDGKTVTTYIGDVTADHREEALRHAWSLAYERHLLDAR